MAKAHRDPMFGRQLLAHHVGVAAVPEEPLAQPLVQPVEHRAPGRLAERRRAALTEVPPHRVPCATELASQALRTPTEPVQQIGRASCRERVCQTVSFWVFAGTLKKKNTKPKYY